MITFVKCNYGAEKPNRIQKLINIMDKPISQSA